MRREVLDRYDLITIGEAGGGTADAIHYSNLDGSELNMTFGFEHTDGINDHNEMGKWSDLGAPLAEVRQIMNRWELDLQGKAWNTTYMSNHDQPARSAASATTARCGARPAPRCWARFCT